MNNIKPRTREEREALANKELIEKSRINQRVGLEARNVNMQDILHNAHPKSTLFINENERFDKDFAVHDRNQRQKERMLKDMGIEKHRLEALERDAQRWEKMEHEANRADQVQDFKRQVFLHGKHNMSGMPFNPITLEYERSEQGQSLMEKDEAAKVRAYLRATNLDSRSNCGYNVLTGEGRKEVTIPNQLQEKYKEKIETAYQMNSIKNYNNASNRYY